MMAPDIRLAGLAKSYGAVEAVRDVDLEVAAGEFFTMLGPSGSGKTTTLRLIAGFERPDAGVIELQGSDVSQIPPYSRNVNTVFQDYALFPHMTRARERRVRPAREEGAEGRSAPSAPTRRSRWCACPATATAAPASCPAASASASRSRARSSTGPAVLLLDEPLGALDLKLRQQMQFELKQIQQEVGITFVYVTHDQEEALTMSDRIAVFNEGRIEQIGPPNEVYEKPANLFVAGFVGVSNVLERDGKRFTVRPEKIRILDEGEPADGYHVEGGTIAGVSYAGMITRLRVELDAGGELQVVRQNLETTSQDALEQQGRKVRLGWREEHTYAIENEKEEGS